MTEDRTVAVYGATGRTGSLVCRELASRGRDFVASGRNLPKLERLSSFLGTHHQVVPTLREAAVDAPGQLERMLDGVQVLVNCAGPFVDLGRPVAEAAVRASAHYLDTTGEQTHIRWVADELGPRAADRGVVVAPACAFEYAVGSVAASLALDRGGLSEVGVCYAVRDFSPSPGTVKSITRAVTGTSMTFREGRRETELPAARSFDVPFPGGSTVRALSFPGGEPIIVPAFRSVDRVESCVAVGGVAGTVLSAVRPAIPPMASALEPLVDTLADRSAPDDPWEEGSHDENAGAAFTVPAFEPDGTWHAAVSGNDPYRATARIAVEHALRVPLSSDGPSGFHTPASLYEAEGFAAGAGLDVAYPD